MAIKLKISLIVLLVLTALIFTIDRVSTSTNLKCPTPETFVNDFNSWSIEFLAANPGYAEKEQREGWKKYLEETGCAESQNIINNAVNGGSTSDYE